MPLPFVATLTPAQAQKLQQDIQQQGFEISKPEYTLFSAKRKGISCTLYQSKKLVVQGQEAAVKEWIEFYLEPEVLQNFSFTHAKVFLDLTPRIGVDESGKGDVFGPLCVAGLYATGQQIEKLQELGVMDSKNLNEKAIRRLGAILRKEFATYVVRFQPHTYNTLYAKFRNLNRMLAWAHATVIMELSKKTGCSTALIDQFTESPLVAEVLQAKNIPITLTQRVRAESDPIVAGASILARLGFLEGLDELETRFQQSLPKGASAACIKAGRALYANFGEEGLTNATKLHFKTLDAIRQKG